MGCWHFFGRKNPVAFRTEGRQELLDDGSDTVISQRTARLSRFKIPLEPPEDPRILEQACYRGLSPPPFAIPAVVRPRTRAKTAAEPFHDLRRKKQIANSEVSQSM